MAPDIDHPALVPIGRVPWPMLLITAAVVCACRCLASIPCHLYDDAFITMRYARNLAAGAGFVYNPGAPWEPVLGTTTPAYTLVLALASFLGAELTHAAVLINALCDALIAVLLFRMVRARSEIAAFITVAAFAAMPQLNRISAGGMESPMFVLAVLAAISLDAARHHRAAGVLAVLSATVRPEGVLVLPLIAARHLRSARTLVQLVVPAALLGLGYVVVMTLVFGSPIPQSVSTKADHYLGDGGWRRIVEIFSNSFIPSVPLTLAAPLTLVGVFGALRAGGPLRTGSGFLLALTAAYLAARPMMPGWYYYPILTGVCAWIGLGTATLLERGLPKTAALFGHRAVRPLATAALLAVVAPVAWVALLNGKSEVQKRIYTPIQTWAAELTTPQTTLLAFDIGCIGYVTDARILDAGGLVWPAAKKERSPAALVKRHQPDYALITAVRQWVEPMRTDAVLSTAYVPVRRFNAEDDHHLDPPADTLPTAWTQDYILYARRDQVARAEVDKPAIEGN